MKQASGSAQDFLTWFGTMFLTMIEGSFAVHHKRWYRGTGRGAIASLSH
jgi:hypothetical protein